MMTIGGVEESGEKYESGVFQRSSKLIRSPVLQAAASTSSPSLEKENPPVASGVSAQQTAPDSVDITKNQATVNNQVSVQHDVVELSNNQETASNRNSVIKKTALTVDISQFMQIKKHVEYLAKMFGEKNRRSIIQEMRDAAFAASKCISNVEGSQGDTDISTTENFSQTSPLIKGVTGGIPKRKTENHEGTPLPKRSQKSKKDVVKIPLPDEPTTEQGAWSDVVNKKKLKKAKKKESRALKPKKVRPDAIVIKAGENITYADILRQVKSDPKLKEVGEAISKIRRTQKGELLLQLVESGGKSAQVSEKIREVIGQQAEVKALCQRSEIEIKNVDEVTSKEEVAERIKEQFDFDIPPTDVFLRKAYGGMQTASVSLTSDLAKKMLEVGRIKIGWSSCHIREKAKAMIKCFRCLEFGHMAKMCKSEDRSKLCRKCGIEGHVAKDCKNEPSCMFCKSSDSKDDKHVAGSAKCPVFRKALSKRS